ncbi:MAG: hypothetical protein AAGG07_06905 [Planctomycetota bacterium]
MLRTNRVLRRRLARPGVLLIAVALLIGGAAAPDAQAQLPTRAEREHRREIAQRIEAVSQLVREERYEEATPEIRAIWEESPKETATDRLLLADFFGVAAFSAAREDADLRQFFQQEFDRLDDKVQNDRATFLELDLWLILAHILGDGTSPIEWFDRIKDFEIAPQAFGYLSNRLSKVLIQRSRFDDLIVVYQLPQEQIEIYLKRIRRIVAEASQSADPEAALAKAAPQLQMLRREVSLRLIALEAAGLHDQANESSQLISRVDPSEEMAAQVTSALSLLQSAGVAATREGRVRVFTPDGREIGRDAPNPGESDTTGDARDAEAGPRQPEPDEEDR